MNSPTQQLKNILSDDEIEALAIKHIAPGARVLAANFPGIPAYQETAQFRRVKALIADVMEAQLAAFRDAFPVPAAGSQLELMWQEAMSEPEAVPAYIEAAISIANWPIGDERAAFEAKYPVPSHCQWTGKGYAATEYNAWDAHRHNYRWDGWSARAALSSAPGAVKCAAAPCQTCNDQGAVGNILTAEPCPECTPPAGAQNAHRIIDHAIRASESYETVESEAIVSLRRQDARIFRDTLSRLGAALESAPVADPVEQILADRNRQATLERAGIYPDAETDAPVTGKAHPVAWFIDWPDEPDLGHYIGESATSHGRSRPLVFADAVPQTSEPVYAQAAAEALVTNAELLALLPGTYYMDPPDGGGVSVLEQLQRMAADAARYRWLKDPVGWRPVSISAWHHDQICEIKLGDEKADAAIDAAIANQGQQ